MVTPVWKKRLIITLGFLENLVFTGNILGWSALSQMLKEEHVYEHLCERSVGDTSDRLGHGHGLGNGLGLGDGLELVYNVSQIYYFSKNRVFSIDSINSSKPNVCVEQDKALNLAYTIGSFFNGFTAFVWGFLLDKWGLRVVRLIINSFLTIGTVMLCMLNKDRSYLVFPAVTFLCLGGIPLRVTNMQFANLYPKRRSSIIALYSGAFSASAITFVLLKYLFENGVSFFWTNSVLVFLTFLMTIFTFTLLPKDKIREESVTESKEVLTFSKNGHSCRVLQQLSPVTLEKFTFVKSSFRKVVQPKLQDTNSFRNSQSTIVSTGSTPKEVPLKYSLLSLPYILHQWWYAWLITYLVMYVGSMNLWLQRITTDANEADHLVKLYGVLQVLALVIAPIAGFIMDHEVNKADSEPNPELRWLKKIKSGFGPMMFTTSCVAASLIARFFDDQNAVYASIVVITLFRSFLVAVSSAFLRIRFPAEHFNRLLGILSTIGACVTLVQFPLFVFEANSVQNAIWVNVFNCVCTLIAYLNPLHLTLTSLQTHLMRKEKKQWLMNQ